MSKGYIYLGFDQTSTGVKIGKSKNWEKRQQQISNMNPTFTVFLQWEVGDMDLVEKQLHKHLGAKQLQSEWFDLSAEDIAWIAETLDGEKRGDDWKQTVSVMTGVRRV